MQSPSDAALIERILGGEREAYARLVNRYQDALYRHADGMVGDGDAAADLVQDAFVKAYARLGECDPDRFAPWLFRILRNLCRDWLKNRRQRTVPLTDDVATPDRDDPATGYEAAELARTVRDALLRLPARQREAFLLRHVEEMSYEEMAERLQAGVSAMKMRVMRARETLQELLRDLR